MYTKILYFVVHIKHLRVCVSESLQNWLLGPLKLSPSPRNVSVLSLECQDVSERWIIVEVEMVVASILRRY
jgi:hypothetical protein